MPREIEIDHVVPVTAGGGNDYHNLVVACFPCNMRKSAHSGGFMIANVNPSLRAWWQDFLTNPPKSPLPDIETLSIDDLSEKEMLSAAMAILGKRKSEKKAASSKANGARGGRPRKTTEEEDATKHALTLEPEGD